MNKTRFAGLTQLDRSDPLAIDNASFQSRNPEITDRLLEIGAVTHRHDQHVALANPSQLSAPSGNVVPSGGNIPAAFHMAFGYTLLDANGGETLLSGVGAADTQPGYNPPASTISGSADYTGGALVTATYHYGITMLDGTGGETALGPTISVERQPGYASGRVNLSGLSQDLGLNGASAWALYRAVGGGAWAYIASGTADTFVDPGIQCVDCSRTPPDGQGNQTTNQANTLLVRVPTDDPAWLRSTGFNLYLTLDGSFADGMFVGSFPLSSGGVDIPITQLEFAASNPPDVSTCYPGAHLIDPDTELLDWHWKRPVVASASLGSGTYGDVRLVEQEGWLYGVLASGGAQSASGWTRIPSGVSSSGAIGPAGPPGAPGGTGPAGPAGAGTALAVGLPRLLQVAIEIDFVGSGGTGVAVTDLGGGSAQVLISGGGSGSGATGPAGPTGPTGPPGTGQVAVGLPRLLSRSEIDFVGSGGAGVAVTDLGGGSAQVLIGIPPAGAGSPFPMTESVGSAAWQDSTGHREWIMGSASAAVGPPGVVAEDNYETLGASPLANYTNLGNSTPSFVAGVGLRDNGADFSEPVMRWETQTVNDQQIVRMKFKWDNPANWIGAGAGTGVGNHNAMLALIDVGAAKLRCTDAAVASVADLVDSGTGVALTGGLPAAGSTCWLELVRNGNQITVNEYRADPALGALPNTTLSFTIATAPDVANLGAGVTLKPIFEARSSFTHPAYTIKDLQVRAQTTSTPLHGIWGAASGANGDVIRKFMADDGSSDFYDIPYGQRHRFLIPTASGGTLGAEMWLTASASPNPSRSARELHIAILASGGARRERILMGDYGNFPGSANGIIGDQAAPMNGDFGIILGKSDPLSGSGTIHSEGIAIKGNVGIAVGRDPNFDSMNPYDASPAGGQVRPHVQLSFVDRPWHDIGAGGQPAFANGWSNGGVTGAPNLAYALRPDYTVELRGTVTGGTVGAVPIFTLPAGQRPIGVRHFPCISNGALGIIEIQPNGEVRCTVGNNASVSLDGVEFRAEQ